MKYLSLILAVLLCVEAHASPIYQQFSIKSQTTVSVPTTSTQELLSNDSRGYLMIQNKGTDSVFIKVGSTIAGAEGLTLGAGASYEFHVCPTDGVWMKANSGTQAVVILEGLAK